MDDDAIAQFLLSLPGFNDNLIEDTRREIVSRHYDLEELPYLWLECADGHNPIGLFSYKVMTGKHSSAYQLEKIELRKREDQQREAASKATKQKRSMKSVKTLKADDSVTADHLNTWDQIVNELRLDYKPNTFAAYIEPARPISINGAWTIAVPAVEWWDGKMSKDLPRIYKKLTGKETLFNFVKDAQ